MSYPRRSGGGKKINFLNFDRGKFFRPHGCAGWVFGCVVRLLAFSWSWSLFMVLVWSYSLSLGFACSFRRLASSGFPVSVRSGGGRWGTRSVFPFGVGSASCFFRSIKKMNRSIEKRKDSKGFRFTFRITLWKFCPCFCAFYLKNLFICHRNVGGGGVSFSDGVFSSMNAVVKRVIMFERCFLVCRISMRSDPKIF